MTKTVAIIQARMGSSRLPGKVLEAIAGRPAIGWVVRAAAAVPEVDRVVVATSVDPRDDAVAAWCAENGVTCHRGSEDDVLNRFADAARAEGAAVVMRLTADCPLLDPEVCRQVVTLRDRTDADYASNANPWTWPDGLDCEVFTAAALYEAEAEARRTSEREHVTPFIRNRRARYRSENLQCPIPGLKRERWTLDTADDLAFIRAVAERLANDAPPAYLDVLAVLRDDPDLRRLNARPAASGGAAKTAAAEPLALDRRYDRSREMLARACRVIPLGSQTFSKCHQQYPPDAAPQFLTHGDGGRVWDVDGNEYVDLVGGLLPVVLGYRDPDVDDAIRRQLDAGISFSLATELETQLAERLIRIIPCAEMVRFGKNGTDATSAAIRLARAHTGRDHVAVCGYHGWQDWYIGATTRHKGIPDAVRALTHSFPYNDLDALEALFKAHPGAIAAVILEPMNIEEPKPGYLEAVRDLAHANGALLVFDEVITGFRYALGGAQELFGVTPDLASFGKAMANGMPISAIVGSQAVMAEMEDVFLSSTFGGEALSIAAAIAVIDKFEKEAVIDRLRETGRELAERARKRVADHGLDDVIRLSGQPSWTLLAFKERGAVGADLIRTLFIQEMLRAGVLTLGSHNVCHAHDALDVDHVDRAYDHALSTVAAALRKGDFTEHLPRGPIVPVFKVR